MAKTAKELQDEVCEHADLREFLNRAPETLTKVDYERLVETLRAERASWNFKGDK